LAAELQTSLKAAELGAPFSLTQLTPTGGNKFVVQLGLRDRPRQQHPRVADFQTTPGYFETLGIPIVAGRDLRAGETGAVLVNQTLAASYWPEGALGQTVDLFNAPHRIVGIVRDTYAVGLDLVEPVLYRPFTPGLLLQVLVRSRAPGVTQAIEAAAMRIEPGMRARTKPLSDNLDLLLDGPRLGAQVAGIFGIYALALAAVGMFGVFAYAVQQRTKEIGIRMALGARPAQVIGLVLRGSSLAMLIGFLTGLALAAAASRLLTSFLHDLSPFNARTYILVSAILAAAALAASYLPSRRAARIDPMAALRRE
jgi:hypothetical protein